jgi:hypothetical protein
MAIEIVNLPIDSMVIFHIRMEWCEPMKDVTLVSDVVQSVESQTLCDNIGVSFSNPVWGYPMLSHDTP